MDGILSQYEVKLKKLLEKFLDPDFQIRNDVYINTLFSHLSGQHDKDLSEELLKLPLFSEWLLKACAYWEKKGIQPSPCTSTFVLHLISLLSKDEKIFTYFKTYNMYNTICSILKVKAPGTSPAIKLAYLKMLTSFLNHRSGLDWLISTDNWRDGLNYSLEGQTIYLIREAKQFIYNLLQQSIDYNNIFCDLVIKRIIQKLNDFQCQNKTGFPEVREESLLKHTSFVLKLILHILERHIETKNSDYRVPVIFITSYHLEKCIWKVGAATQIPDIVLDCDKILICIYFLQLFMLKLVVVPPPELKQLGVAVMKLINHRMLAKQHIIFLKLCHYTDYMWTFVLPNITQPISEDDLLKLELQLLPLQILPVVIVTFKHCSIIAKDFDNDDMRDIFITKLFKTMNEQTTRLCYQWKNIVMAEEEIFSMAQQSLMLIMTYRKYYSKNRAIIIFQSCIYAFKDIINTLKDGRTTAEIFYQNSAYLISLINCLSTFINEHEITWTESVETMCVLNATLDFLSLSRWSTRVVIEALKLLNLSISKYMSPNLALLIDKTQDSALDQIGPLLINKLHDMNWEIRDSALEILITISTFACSKFPSFQRVIIDSDLITLVVSMAVSDSESFVRASAIKCLQEMIKVNDFWNPILIQQQLPEKMIQMLNEETEAIVRTEAACLVKCIYEHQSFPVEMMDDVYKTMVSAATTDLHWEVKTNALDFWCKVILNHLQNQGMIDGRFPDVTFSKEHKKIVTLTEKEIKYRLSKVLYQLSQSGCLGVFVAAMQDDCDLEVMKTAAEKMKKIAKFFNLYNMDKVYTCSKSPTTPSHVSTSQKFNPPIHPSTLNTPPITPRMDYSDEVIDQIVQSSDINLLTNVYNPSDEVSTRPKFNTHVVEVTPEAFLSVLHSDLDAIVNEKTKWLQNIDDLNSLLDDMLKCYNGDVNSMDCY
ncbi:brca1-associated atm activator 1 [Holotrichia oblita]|uniref:Brca1-associated atm activator 1 n=1 Tax=Holotrichia oblita TaxID=644536 RepID=A0ACB9SSY2_HOLOL|nr:brca1-associated atm activator 1 [Holotrichia oblita]